MTVGFKINKSEEKIYGMATGDETRKRSIEEEDIRKEEMIILVIEEDKEIAVCIEDMVSEEKKDIV